VASERAEAGERGKRKRRDPPGSAVDVESVYVTKRRQTDGAGRRVDVEDIRVEDIRGAGARLGGGQKGMVTRAELVAAGVHPMAVTRGCRAGALHRRHRGVYAVGHEALAPFAVEQAALLACGPRAFISHRSAAWLWGLSERRPPVVDVTIVGSQRRPKVGVRLRRVQGIERRDMRRRHNLPITSPARTIVDLAADTSGDELERLIAEARAKGLLRSGELEKAVERSAGRRGIKRLRALLKAEGGPGVTRSEAER
jgi:hypothetical protein